MIFFVPARKGSQRVNGKNTRPVCGRPLIAWTFDRVDAARSTGDSVVVSSDDPQVLDLALRRGYESRERPADFCGPQAKMSDVLFHVLSGSVDPADDAVCVLYPTSLLRTHEHIRAAVQLWRDRRAEGAVVMSVAPVYHRPYGLLSMRQDGVLSMNRLDGAHYYQQQNQPVDYRANGAVYVVPLALIRERLIDPQLFGPKTIAFFMPEEESVEVDTEQDLAVSEFLLRQRIESGVLP